MDDDEILILWVLPYLIVWETAALWWAEFYLTRRDAAIHASVLTCSTIQRWTRFVSRSFSPFCSIFWRYVTTSQSGTNPVHHIGDESVSCEMLFTNVPPYSLVESKLKLSN